MQDAHLHLQDPRFKTQLPSIIQDAKACGIEHVVVNGTVNGNIASSGHVELQASAKVTGDIHYKAVEMELGAVLNGNLVSDTSAPVYDVISGGAESQEG